MAKKKFVVCSMKSAEQFAQQILDDFKANKYTEYSWTVGPLSSMPQKALIHIWFRKWVAFLFKKPEDTVTINEVEQMKYSVKKNYYNETGDEFMVEKVVDMLTPDREKLQYTSITDWEHGECFNVMSWMQDKAAENGLILESTGEYAKNKKAQHNR